METINLTDSIMQRSDLLASQLNNDLIILHHETGKYLHAGPVGNRIWKLIEQPITLTELHRELLEIYNVDTEICRIELLEFVQQLLEEQLITHSR